MSPIHYRDSLLCTLPPPITFNSSLFNTIVAVMQTICYENTCSWAGPHHLRLKRVPFWGCICVLVEARKIWAFARTAYILRSRNSFLLNGTNCTRNAWIQSQWSWWDFGNTQRSDRNTAADAEEENTGARSVALSPNMNPRTSTHTLANCKISVYSPLIHSHILPSFGRLIDHRAIWDMVIHGTNSPTCLTFLG